jgi:hypothetical protein
MAPHWSAADLERWRTRIVELPVEDAASTDARRLLAAEGAESPGLPTLLPAGVLDFIRARKLYSSVGSAPR